LVLMLLFCVHLAVAAPSISYEDLADGRPDHIAKGELRSYTASNGALVEPGSRLGVGVAAGASATGIVSGGQTTSVVAAVSTDYFRTIANGGAGATNAKAFLAGLAQNPNPALWMAPPDLSGAELTVQSVELTGTRRSPRIFVHCEVAHRAEAVNRSGVARIIDLEEAIRMGEVVDIDALEQEEASAERSEAIARLKEAKDLVDLEIYTQEQYDELKAELTPIILGATAPAAPAGDASASQPSAPGPDPTRPNSVQSEVRFKGEDGATEVSEVVERVRHDSFDLGQCFEAPGETATMNVRFRPSGDMARVTGDEAPCLVAILEDWKIGPTTFPASLSVKLTAQTVQGLEPPAHSRTLIPVFDHPDHVHLEVTDDGDGKFAEGRYAIEAVMDGYADALATCFREPEAEATASFTVRMDGTLGKVTASGPAGSCITGQLETWQTRDVGWPAKLVLSIKASSTE